MTPPLVAVSNELHLVVSPIGEPPFSVEAQAVEDDTYLVLGSDPEFRQSAEHPVRVHTAALEARAERPGTIVVTGGRPLRLRAIVHDLSRQPTWREEWVGQALVALLRESERREIVALGTPVLGSLHGDLPPAGFLAHLEAAVEMVRPRVLRRLWLQVEPEELEAALTGR